jgi:hypothetical protein
MDIGGSKFVNSPGKKLARTYLKKQASLGIGGRRSEVSLGKSHLKNKLKQKGLGLCVTPVEECLASKWKALSSNQNKNHQKQDQKQQQWNLTDWTSSPGKAWCQLGLDHWGHRGVEERSSSILKYYRFFSKVSHTFPLPILKTALLSGPIPEMRSQLPGSAGPTSPESLPTLGHFQPKVNKTLSVLHMGQPLHLFWGPLPSTCYALTSYHFSTQGMMVNLDLST